MNERYCRTCGSMIPPARLQAMPNAIQCLKCLEKNGDVKRLNDQDIEIPNAEDLEFGGRS